MSSMSQRGPQKVVPPQQSGVVYGKKKGGGDMLGSKAGASEYARWCREVGIQVEVLVESTPPCRGV